MIRGLQKFIHNIIFAFSASAYLFFAFPDREGVIEWLVILAIAFIACFLAPDMYECVKGNISRKVMLFSIIPEFFGIVTLYGHHGDSDELIAIASRFGIGIDMFHLIFFTGCILCGVAALPILLYLCVLLKLIKHAFPKWDPGEHHLRADKILIAGFILIAVIQLGLNIFWGGRKSYYLSGDEFLTMWFVDHVDQSQKVSFEDNTWLDSEVFREMYTPSAAERFNYFTPFMSEVIDVHPPLYYYAVHTANSIASLAGAEVGKWSGMLPNFFFNAVTTAILLSLLYDMTGNRLLSLACTALWALSVGATESAVFVRMYSMCTMWAVLLAYAVWMFYKSAVSGEIKAMPLSLIIFSCMCGALTQYYSIVWCTLLFLSFGALLLLKGRVQEFKLFFYSFSAAAILAVFLFPRMITHIFSSYRGIESFRNTVAAGYLSKLSVILRQISEDTYFEGIAAVFLILAVMIWAAVRLFKTAMDKRDVCMEAAFFIICCAVFYVLVIAKVTPIESARYFMCIYPFLLGLPLVLLSRLAKFDKGGQALFTAIATVLILMQVCLSYRIVPVNTAQTTFGNEYEEGEVFEKYAGYPAIMFVSHEDRRGMSFELVKLERVFFCTDDDKEAIMSLDGRDFLLCYDEEYINDMGLSGVAEKNLQGYDIIEVFSGSERHILCAVHK